MTRLDDRIAIEQVLYRYARSVDRLDYTGISDCYFPDAIDRHGNYHGNAAGLVDDIRKRHATIDSSQHFISNVIIEFADPTTADVESYCLCYLRQTPPPGHRAQQLATIRCRYIDRFEHREQQWRIADRTVVFDEYRTECITDELDPNWIHAKRDRADPLYRTPDP